MEECDRPGGFAAAFEPAGLRNQHTFGQPRVSPDGGLGPGPQAEVGPRRCR